MEKFRKVLLAIGLMFMLSNDAYATSELGEQTDSMKFILFAVAIILIVAILLLSYKADKPTELKPKKKKETDGKDNKKEKNNKKDKLKDELVEKDNTYEVEENEMYEDDKIEPVSIAKDEDEISLFESVNNPDTEREDFIIEEEISNVTTSAGVTSNIIENIPAYDGNDDTVNDFFAMDDEEIEIEENVGEDSTLSTPMTDIFVDGMLDEEEDEVEEVTSNNDMSGTMVFNSNELNGKLDIFAMDEEEAEEEVIGAPKVEESNEDLFIYNYDDETEDVVEEKQEEIEEFEEPEEKIIEEPKVEKKSNIDIFAPVPEETEFVGFTTLKQKSQTRGGNSRFDRVANVEKEEVVKTVSEENSADDFLAQMEQNLGGKKVTKTTKKTATKKETTTKKTPAKKPAAKKTTTTKAKADKK